MPDMPECLHRRYRVLDELIEELTKIIAAQEEQNTNSEDHNDAGIKLLCQFWNILKEDPDCDLTKVVYQKMGLNKYAPCRFKPQRLACYMADRDGCNSPDDDGENHNEAAEKNNEEAEPQKDSQPETVAASSANQVQPSTPGSALLSKVLCDLKEAVSFDKKCNARIAELTKTQQELQEQIQQLEDREKEGTQLLKQAECMWSCMESAYKKKIKESLERQSELLKQMKQVETSNIKWRKNKKDLELQLQNLDKYCLEVNEKLHQKNNDIKCIKMDVDDFKKRIENIVRQKEMVQKSFNKKKIASEAKIANLSEQMTKAKKVTQDEQKYKKDKEIEGSIYLKTAREDLQQIFRLVLERKLENEDLKTEKEALQHELNLLKKTSEQCEDKCQSKEKYIADEINRIDAEISGFKLRCTKCNQCTRTGEVRKLCTDCPRCAEEKDCIYKDGECHSDIPLDCVCVTTKEKLVDNVFDNMYSVLEQEAKTPAGKALADAVLDCLRKSRNGKLNEPTKKAIQDFVLTTLRKNLNLTIVGGAVKTRCEMDQDTYKKLMLCLNSVKVTPPSKANKSVSKMEPCSRWDDSSECHCPNGPKDCICTKAAKFKVNRNEEKHNTKGMKSCLHKESKPCGAESMHDIHAASCEVGKEVAAWRPEPCNDNKCSFSKNMRAAQCILGPELLNETPWTKMPHPPEPDISGLEDQVVCKCGFSTTKPCVCRTSTKQATKAEQCDEKSCQLIWKPCEEESNISEPTRENWNKLKNNETIKIEQQDGDLKINFDLQRRKDEQETKEKSSELEVNKKREDNNKTSADNQKSNKAPEKKKYSESTQLHSHSSNLKKTPSGTLSLELDKKVVRKLEKKLKKYPTVQASVKKSDTGEFVIDFSETEDSQTNLYIFKKSRSGSLLMDKQENAGEGIKEDIINEESLGIILEAPVQRETKGSLVDLRKTNTVVDVNEIPKHACHQQRDDTNTKSSIKDHGKPKLFKILIRASCQEHDCTLAVLEATKSNNYILNVDKEYEKQFIKTIREQIGCDFECPIELTKTVSEIIIGLLDNKQLSATTPNAILTLSLSGNVKIKPDFCQSHINKIFSSDTIKASKVISNIVNNFSAYTKESLTLPNETDKKSISDSQLLERVKMQTQQNLLTDSGTLLKRTKSGHYAIILNKDSKKILINNLKSYVSSNSHGKLPMKRTSQGEIIIRLNSDNNEINQCNSLKISPSGNMFVLVDEDFLKKCAIVDDVTSQSPKCEGIQSIQEVMNKSVTTTCNALPDNTCDSSKCVCGNLLLHEKTETPLDYFDANCVPAFKFCPVEDIHYDCKKNKCHYQPASRYSEGLLNVDDGKENSPHIVMKQCTCPNKENKNTDPQLFYMYQSVCPFHKDRYDTVSNDLLEITGLCNKLNKPPQLDSDNGSLYSESLIPTIVKSSDGSSLHHVSDYLEYLPPQLPSFLRGFKST